MQMWSDRNSLARCWSVMCDAHVHARTGTRSRKKRRERSGHRSPRSPKGATEGSGGKEGGELGPRPTRSPGQRDPGRQTATTVVARRAKQAAAKVINRTAVRNRQNRKSYVEERQRRHRPKGKNHPRTPAQTR